MWTRVIAGEERTDDELAGLDRGDRATDLLDNAAVLVPHRTRLGDRADAAVGPQVGPADAGGRHPDDGVGRMDDGRVGALLESHIARAIENSSSHGFISRQLSSSAQGVPAIDNERVTDHEACARDAQPQHGARRSLGLIVNYIYN